MGSLLTFVNAVADAVAQKHPDVKVGTLSYWYSRRPPATIKPRPNVQIQLCSIECCLIHPINDPECPRNVAFCRDMQQWGTICDQIYICAYRAMLEPVWYPRKRTLDPELIAEMRPLARRFFELCDRYAVDRPRESREDINGVRKRLKQAFGLAKTESF